MNPTLANLQRWHLDAAGAAALVVLTAAAWFLGADPLRCSHEAWQDEKADLATQQEQAAKLDASLVALQRRLEDARKARANGGLQLRSAASVNSQLMQISALATDCGLTIDDVRADRPQPGPYFDTIPIDLAGAGTYRACTVFLSRLGQKFADTTVLSLRLSADTGNPSATGKFAFRIQWHAAPTQPAVAAR